MIGRKIAVYTLIGLGFLTSLFTKCEARPSEIERTVQETVAETAVQEPIVKEEIVVEPLEEMIYDTFSLIVDNPQILGDSKMEKTDVMDIKVDIYDDFDIGAVMEIRDKNQDSFPRLVDLIDASSPLDIVGIESERTGRSSSKESMGIFYDKNKFEILDAYLYDDVNDLFERDPYVVHGRHVDGFDFIWIIAHTKPDDATKEIMYLYEVYKEISAMHSNEKNIFVTGDLNADGTYFDENTDYGLWGDEFFHIIKNDWDTTLGKEDNAYDRMIFSKESTLAYYVPDSGGVIKFDEIYGLDEDFAKTVSDHYPIYAEFRTGPDTD
jgi:deoxyribonuclease-1-like protein